MIPGGWFQSASQKRQHWRRHGVGQSVCRSRVLCLNGGNLLPVDRVPMCAECHRAFLHEAAIALPKYKYIVHRLEQEIAR
jgi:hypothetical protein